MPINSLKRRFEERREMLTETLKKGRNELDPAKQHQIYGAIKEIDNVLSSLEHFRTKASESRIDVSLIEESDLPEDDRSVLQKMTEGTGKFFSEKAVVFNKKVIGGFARFFKGIGDTFSTFREVSREVKRRKREISDVNAERKDEN